MMIQEEWFEKYIHGHLSEREKAVMEARLESDQEFRRRFEEHVELTRGLKQLEREKAFINALKHIESEYHADIIHLKHTHGGRTSKQKEFWFILKVATVAILASLLTLFVWWKTMVKSQMPAHEITNLKLQIHGLKYSQKAIENKIREKNSTHQTTDIPVFQGSGFFVHSKGYILTSYHIIHNADSIYVSGPSVQPCRAKVLEKDSLLDLALIQLPQEAMKEKINLPYSLLSGTSFLGEKVFVLGYPGAEQVFGEGSLSAMNGFDGDTSLYQISVPLNPGNSGGPLWSESGCLIGIIRGKNFAREGNSYAVKSSLAVDFLKKAGLNDVPIVRNSPERNVRIRNFVQKISPMVVKVYAWQKYRAD